MSAVTYISLKACEPTMVLSGRERAGCAYASCPTLQKCQETSESNSAKQHKLLSLLQVAQHEHLQVQRSECVIQA